MARKAYLEKAGPLHDLNLAVLREVITLMLAANGYIVTNYVAC